MTQTNTAVVSVFLDGQSQRQKVGRIAWRNRHAWFEYDPSFLTSGLQISPFHLNLEPGVIESPFEPCEGLHGVFNDSLPDGWGRLLIDRKLAGRGHAPYNILPLDRLCQAGNNTMGALTYEPDLNDLTRTDISVNLDRLQSAATDILQGKASDILDDLANLGGSPGGARPKIVVGVDADHSNIIHGADAASDGFSSWIIKFRSTNDHEELPAIEMAYSLMAKSAGVEMSETHLFHGESDSDYFGTKRFDREGPKRFHMLTACGLLHASFRVPGLDYKDLLKATRALTRDMREVKKMFRLAIFNVFAHNRDDHSKNFSFLMDEKGTWKVAPAYDLTWSIGPGGEHSTMVMGEGRAPTRDHLFALGKEIDLSEKYIGHAMDEVSEAISSWQSHAANAGLSKTATDMVVKFHT